MSKIPDSAPKIVRKPRNRLVHIEFDLVRYLKIARKRRNGLGTLSQNVKKTKMVVSQHKVRLSKFRLSRQNNSRVTVNLCLLFSSTANTEVTAPCHAGFYCPPGSDVPNQITCPEGKHCPLQSPEPQDCLAGTYVDYEGASECSVCPEGKSVAL